MCWSQSHTSMPPSRGGVPNTQSLFQSIPPVSQTNQECIHLTSNMLIEHTCADGKSHDAAWPAQRRRRATLTWCAALITARAWYHPNGTCPFSDVKSQSLNADGWIAVRNMCGTYSCDRAVALGVMLIGDFSQSLIPAIGWWPPMVVLKYTCHVSVLYLSIHFLLWQNPIFKNRYLYFLHPTFKKKIGLTLFLCVGGKKERERESQSQFRPCLIDWELVDLSRGKIGTVVTMKNVNQGEVTVVMQQIRRRRYSPTAALCKRTVRCCWLQKLSGSRISCKTTSFCRSNQFCLIWRVNS